MASHHAENFFITDKRQRTATFSRAKRSINKEIISFAATGVDATQEQTVLNTVTFPNTLTGLRWDFAASQDAGTGDATFNWAIIIVRDGELADTMSRTDAAQFYRPETLCLVWGFGMIDNHSIPAHISGSTKTMRKMMTGDSLRIIYVGSTTNTIRFTGAVQFFQKM